MGTRGPPVLLKVTQVGVWAQVDLERCTGSLRLWRLCPKTARVGSDFLRVPPAALCAVGLAQWRQGVRSLARLAEGGVGG